MLKEPSFNQEFGELYLQAGEFVDSDSPSVRSYALKTVEGCNTPKEKALKLYYTIRDGFAYNPYIISSNKADITASHMLTKTSGHCVDKACLLAACARVVGIPSRLGFAVVKNHIGTGRVEVALRTNLLAFHGYVELFLNGKWVKATPAFNKGLCDRLGVEPLQFDGENDSLFQEYDREGGKYMEYVRDLGIYNDLPFELMLATFREYYPHIAGYSKDGRINLRDVLAEMKG